MKQKSRTNLFNVAHLAAMFIALLIFANCDYLSNKKRVTTEVVGTPTDVHVAFAGGGWLAHTGHSAWTVALLDSGKYQLKDIFQNVKTISSNSGGTWFSTMLMYSDQFVSDIQSPSAVENWATSEGWTGKQKIAFHNAYKNNGCLFSSGKSYVACVGDYYTGISGLKSVFYWKPLIEDLVFKDYSLGNLTLGSNRQPWAQDKSLLMASSFLANRVVLSENIVHTKDHNFYQACIAPSQPSLDGDFTKGCNPDTPVDVLAVTFSSLGNKGSLVKPSMFPILGENKKSDSIVLGYTEDFLFDRKHDPKYYRYISNPIDDVAVPLMTVAASSSAAGGFAASEHITGLFDASYEGEDEAISFSLKNSKLEYVEPKGKALTSLVDNKVVRFADGGTVDNSGVAQLVRYIQLNYPNQGNGFNVVAFDNVADTLHVKNGYTGIDIGSLFGVPDPYEGTYFDVTFKIDTPNFQIFDNSALSTAATFNIPGKGGARLIYTKYQVTTIDNEALGISAGTIGTVHSFTCMYPEAEILPQKGAKDFKIYEQMFSFINQALTQNNNRGLNYLREALGAPQAE